MYTRSKRLGVLLQGLMLLLAGCASQPKPGQIEYAPTAPQPPRTATQHSGSIYRQGHDIRLFEDNKASRVGDTLVVLLVEKTDAEKQADTGISKGNETNIENPTLFGESVKFSSSGTPNLGFALKSDSEFTGESESVQSNRLDGSVAVTVSDVLPNGNLIIQGEKWLTLNQGDEYVRIRGIVRRDDVMPDNTVLSTRVADARISYSGSGALHDANSVGWLSRFFLSPLWPF
jgi:flagellar L-ring protein precursor FlgH